jgi:SAM-dependent methyltransferase
VHGIDGSEAMLARLKQRDPDGRVTVQLGDFTKVGTGGQFDLVTILLSTFYAAVTKEQQLACLRNVGDQLAPAGRLVVEVFDPAAFHSLAVPQFSVRHLSESSIMLDTYVVDRSKQLLVGAHTILDGGTPATTSHVLRYVFPSELDLLAELCGLRLVDRWGDWSMEPYTMASTKHVSVYRRATDTG